jgi:hypothetical protein
MANRTNPDVVQGAGKKLWMPLYDSQRYAAAGQTSLSFFIDPKNSNVAGAHTNAAPKALLDTNMQRGGSLMPGQRFTCYGVRVKYKFTVQNSSTNAADLAIAMHTGTLLVKVGDSTKIEQQLIDFNSGVGAVVGGATTVAAKEAYSEYGD